MDLQDHAFDERFFALRFHHGGGEFTYSRDSLQVIAEDLIEEMSKLLSKSDHEFCVSGYPLLDVEIDENELVSFSSADGRHLTGLASSTFTDVLQNLVDLLQLVIVISSPLRVGGSPVAPSHP